MFIYEYTFDKDKYAKQLITEFFKDFVGKFKSKTSDDTGLVIDILKKPDSYNNSIVSFIKYNTEESLSKISQNMADFYHNHKILDRNFLRDATEHYYNSEWKSLDFKHNYS